MRYFEILNEEITNRPRNVLVYLNNREKELKSLLAEFNKAEDLLNKGEDDERNQYLPDYIRYSELASDDLKDVIHSDWRYIVKNIDRYIEIENTIQNIDSIRRHGKDFLKYLVSGIERIEYDRMAPLEIIAKEAKEHPDMFDVGAQLYGFTLPVDDTEIEYHLAKNKWDALVIFSTAYVKYKAVVSDILVKMTEFMKIVFPDYYSKGYRPAHESSEKLFHASTHASDLVVNGFRSVKPADRYGVGNFGTQNTISFTHDFKIAMDIMRCLKEFWMIAHGQLSTKQINGWIKSERMDVNLIRSSLGIGKAPSEVTNISDTLNLYNVYLWYTKLRSNPVFANVSDIEKNMKDVDIGDIGIVQCDVELDDNAEYLAGESEFRVTPDKVKSVKRVR